MWRKAGNEQWTVYWFLLKGGILYIFRNKNVRRFILTIVRLMTNSRAAG